MHLTVFVYKGACIAREEFHLLCTLRAVVFVVDEMGSHLLGCTGYCSYIYKICVVLLEFRFTVISIHVLVYWAQSSVEHLEQVRVCMHGAVYYIIYYAI